jgi:hypothetical protein
MAEETKLAVAGIVKDHAAALMRIAGYLRDDSSEQVALLAADSLDELAEGLCDEITAATGVAMPLVGK